MTDQPDPTKPSSDDESEQPPTGDDVIHPADDPEGDPHTTGAQQAAINRDLDPPA